MSEDCDEEPMLYLFQQPNGYWKIGDEEHWTVCHQVAGDSARLIAAAPELLASLMEACEALDFAQAQVDSESDGIHLRRCRRRIKTVIAKAEGRSE